MKPGNLVKINRASIGIPAGTIGMIVKSHAPLSIELNEKIHSVKLVGLRRPDRRYMARDLEVIS